MDDLHNGIMNIPCDPAPRTVSLYGADADMAYKLGHRDARHAAAELVTAHAAALSQPTTAEAHEANKTALMVLCVLEKANDWHPNMAKDIAFAIEACRAAIAKAAP